VTNRTIEDVGDLPYATLVPVLDALVAAGNAAIDGGFLNSPGGWYCRLANPIDFDLLVETLVLPSSVDLIVDGDTVLDRATWCAVLGPLSDGY
jgi:hypothetical protein